jgi:hypothetical protein
MLLMIPRAIGLFYYLRVVASTEFMASFDGTRDRILIHISGSESDTTSCRPFRAFPLQQFERQRLPGPGAQV